MQLLPYLTLTHPTSVLRIFRPLAATAFFCSALGFMDDAHALEPSELPRPAGVKELSVTPHSAIYLSDSSVEATVDASAKQFSEAGWTPYGIAGPIRFYKLGKTLATVMISPTPAQGGKTAINLSVQTISADLPVPPDAVEVQYSDSTKQLGFTTTQSPVQVAEFYRKALGTTGWTTNMPEPVKSDFKHVIIFRSPGKEMVRIEMTPGEATLRAAVKYQTREEVEAEEARAALQGQAIKKKLADAAAAPKPKFALTLPSETIAKAPNPGGFKFSLPAKKAKAAVESMGKQFEAAGWTKQPGALAAEAGSISFARESQNVVIVYMDPGFMPAEVSLTIAGVEITAELPAKK